MLWLDGVYAWEPGRSPVFVEHAGLTDGDVAKLVHVLRDRVRRCLRKLGKWVDDGAAADGGDASDSGELLPELAAAAAQGRAALGERAGQCDARVGRDGRREPFAMVKAPLCAECDGFSLHAAVVVAARDRERLETLCRYAGRPAVAESRLVELVDGRIGYVLKKWWRDGTTHVVMTKEVCAGRGPDPATASDSPRRTTRATTGKGMLQQARCCMVPPAGPLQHHRCSPRHTETAFTMRKSLLGPVVGVTFLTVGCTRQPEPAQAPDLTRSAPTDTGSPRSQAMQPGPTPLVIDVAPEAEIRGVVRALFQDSRGTLWFGGECDLFRNDGRALTSYDIKDDLGQGVTIKKIVEDKSGNIWCGTSGGITRIDGRSFTSYGVKDGLISRDVWSMAVDQSGVMWIGTIEGACRFDGRTFSPFALPEARPDPTRGVTSGKFVHCITVDRQGRVWLGTNGGAYIYDGKTLTNISERDGLPNNAVGGILEDKSGNIWFGTVHGGISRFDGRDFTNLTEQGIVEGKEIWCLHQGPSGNIWFSGKRSPMYRYDGRAFTKVNEQDGITSLAFNILEDSSGRLWLSGTHGLFRHDGQSFIPVTKDGPWR